MIADILNYLKQPEKHLDCGFPRLRHYANASGWRVRIDALLQSVAWLMFICPTCNKSVFLSECAVCGHSESDTVDIAKEFVEFLRNGRYKRPAPEPPVPFRRRLASFVQCDESEAILIHQWRSSMWRTNWNSLFIDTNKQEPYIGQWSDWE